MAHHPPATVSFPGPDGPAGQAPPDPYQMGFTYRPTAQVCAAPGAQRPPRRGRRAASPAAPADATTCTCPDEPAPTRLARDRTPAELVPLPLGTTTRASLLTRSTTGRFADRRAGVVPRHLGNGLLLVGRSFLLRRLGDRTTVVVPRHRAHRFAVISLTVVRLGDLRHGRSVVLPRHLPHRRNGLGRLDRRRGVDCLGRFSGFHRIRCLRRLGDLGRLSGRRRIGLW